MLISFFKEYGVGWGIVATILILGILFGCACGCGAIFMCIWNYAFVAAIVVCTEIGFWQAVCIVIAPIVIFNAPTYLTKKND